MPVVTILGAARSFLIDSKFPDTALRKIRILNLQFDKRSRLIILNETFLHM